MRLAFFAAITLFLSISHAAFLGAQEHARFAAVVKCIDQRQIYNGVDQGVGDCAGIRLSAKYEALGLRAKKLAAVWEIQSGWHVDTHNPPCGDRYGPDFVKVAARIIAAYYSDGGSEVPGETSFESIFQRVDSFVSGQGGSLASAWRSLHNIQDTSRCQLVVVTVPVPPRNITWVEGHMFDDSPRSPVCFHAKVGFDSGGIPDKRGGECPIDWSAWEQLEIEATKGGAVVAAMAKNWSGDRQRSAGLHVVYIEGP
jgi:hypothetical protein